MSSRLLPWPGDYQIVVPTQDNPAMGYGAATIGDAAEVIHRDLDGAPAAVPRSTVLPAEQAPDEELPPLPQDP